MYTGCPKKRGNSKDWKVRKMKLSMWNQKALNRNIINSDFQILTQKPIFGQKTVFRVIAIIHSILIGVSL